MTLEIRFCLRAGPRRISDLGGLAKPSTACSPVCLLVVCHPDAFIYHNLF
jgi:hypothetical protein